MICHFNGNPGLTIVVNYTTVEGSNDAESHFETLSDIINCIPKHRLILDCGDFNAHLSKDDVAHSYHEKTNTNGEFLIDHINECNLRVTNTMFEKKKGKLWTYISDMNGSMSQIDYILINKKWKNSVHNAEAYSSLSSIGSDHRLVTAKLKLSLRMKRAERKKKIYDWTALKDEATQSQYTVTVKNRFEALSEGIDDITEQYQCFIDANNEAAEKLIPVRKKVKSKGVANDRRI